MTNEFKIISEDGLKTLCKAIKKVSTVGEILDDTNSVTDKTYSSFEIDKRLNTKIDKTQLTTVLDENVTDEQVPSAKAVVDGLENINDFSVQVVKEILDLNDITETGIYFFPQTYTPVNIPVGVNGWLLVMKGNGSRVVKQVWYRQGTANSNSYNTFERYKGGDTWSEWTRFLTEKDYYSALNSGNTTIPQNADLNDYVTAGVYTCVGDSVAKTLANCPHITSNFKLIVNKNTGGNGQFFGYQMIVGSVGINPVKDVCIYYRSAVTNNGVYVFSKWKIMSGSTVADVPKTYYSLDTNCDGVYEKGDKNKNNCWYAVRNGWCIVQIDLKCLQVDAGYKRIFDSLPKSIEGIANVIMSNDKKIDEGDKPLIVTIGPDGMMKAEGGKLDGRYIGTFTYPVAE